MNYKLKREIYNDKTKNEEYNKLQEIYSEIDNNNENEKTILRIYKYMIYLKYYLEKIIFKNEEIDYKFIKDKKNKKIIKNINNI